MFFFRQKYQKTLLEGAFSLLVAFFLPQSILAQNEVPSLPPVLPTATPSIPVDLVLREVRLEGSTVFSSEQVNEQVASYLEKTVTFADLLTIQTRLSEMYLQAGYVTSLVILPETENQNLESGIITYRALEGQLEDLKIEQLTHLRESYVRERLLPYASTPININQLEAATSFYNKYLNYLSSKGIKPTSTSFSGSTDSLHIGPNFTMHLMGNSSNKDAQHDDVSLLHYSYSGKLV